MHVRSDDRAVSELLGAILLFGLLLLLLVLAQFALVPSLNQQAEIEHEARVTDDLGALQESMFRVAATGSPEQTQIEAGLTHPKYPFLLNPPPVRGYVETLPEGTLSLSNVTSANVETADYWERGPVDVGSYLTAGGIRYSADYYEHGDAGTIFLEGSVLYTDFDGTKLVSGEQVPLVSGRRITLVTIDGDLSENDDGSIPVALSSISGPARATSVTNTVDAGSDEPITVEFATGLSAAKWTEILEDEIDGSGDTGNDRFVHAVEQAGDRVRVVFESGVTYDLRMAAVGIGENLPQEAPAYLTRDVTSFSVVPVGGGEVFVEARDRYNNPVSGASVTFAITSGNATLSDSTVKTDEDGRAVVTVNSGVDGVVGLRAYGDFDGGADTDGDADPIDPHESVEFDVQVGSGSDDDDDDDDRTDPGDTTDEINPNDDGALVYLDAELNCTGSGNKCFSAGVDFENRGTAKTIDRVRVNFYQANRQGSSNTDYPAAMFVDAFPGERFEVRGEYVDVTDVTYGPGATFTWTVSFDDFDGDDYNMQNGNTLAITVLFADGTKSTYFVIPNQP